MSYQVTLIDERAQQRSSYVEALRQEGFRVNPSPRLTLDPALLDAPDQDALIINLAFSRNDAGLQTFLRRMESLDLLVESSELEIKAAVKPKDEQDSRGLESRTQLTLQLSFYDMAQEAHGNSDNSKTNSAP